MNYKLGKRPAKIDEMGRTFKLTNFVTLPPFPPQYDFDDNRPVSIPLRMFGNDEYSDCVEAGSANAQIRFEVIEQGRVIPVTDEEVIVQYLKEADGFDSGLVMLDHLKIWRKRGLLFAGNRYTIDAFATIDLNPDHLKAAIYLLGIVYGGFLLPDSFQEQFDSGEVWNDLNPNPQNGHCMTACGYDEDGITLLSWKKKQKATWDWVSACSDEIYGIVQNKQKWLRDSPVDVKHLEQLLREVT